MSRFITSDSCEAFSGEISAFLDGELPFPESLAAVDHLATCEGCRRFYLDSRQLAERLVSEATPVPSGQIWERIAARAGTDTVPPLAARRRRRQWVTGAAVAAILVLAFTVSLRSFRGPAPGALTRPEAASSREIVIEGSRGRMTDERFISLLAEILAADKRYHRETERVLRLVLGRETPVESDDQDSVRSEDEREQETNRGEGTHEKRAGLSS